MQESLDPELLSRVTAVLEAKLSYQLLLDALHKAKIFHEHYNRVRDFDGVKDYNIDQLENDYRMGLIVSQMIMCIASVSTDIAIFEKECGDLGVDWRDALFFRTQYALEEWDALAFAKSI